MSRQLLWAVLFTLAISFGVQDANAQQKEIHKWSLYGGYSYLNTPTENLTQNGFDISFGRNLRRWIAAGVDFSRFTGSATRSGAPLLPIQVPFDATTTTLAVGPQIEFRQAKWVTPFVRPALGWLHESVEVPLDKLSAVLPPGVPVSLIPPSLLKQTDNVVFYGAGGGIDFNVTKPVAVRFSTDYFRSGLFNSDQNNVRLAIGLVLRFGGELESK